jgi:NAD(P)-dependent dehydrogenase (short-subunit alcohol dehydrogenase family)
MRNLLSSATPRLSGYCERLPAPFVNGIRATLPTLRLRHRLVARPDRPSDGLVWARRGRRGYDFAIWRGHAFISGGHTNAVAANDNVEHYALQGWKRAKRDNATVSDIGIITGAAGGIGQATAERFARDGWDLVLVDVADSVKQTAADVAKKSGRKAIGVSTDITKEAGLPPIDAAIKDLGGKLKFLGLIAGVLQKVGPIEHLDLHEWDRVLNINVRANVILMKHFIPTLRAAGGGSIVTVSSWYGKSGHGLFSAYCASKAALISLTHCAAAELASDKIRVNSVAPGNVATDMHFRALREEADKRSVTFEAMKDIEWNKIPLGRAAEPAEVASAIAYLTSSDGAYLTGATIDVNGGCMFT